MPTEINVTQCRVCLDKDGVISLFNHQHSLSISAKIMSLAKVQIDPSDGLPSMICNKCERNVNICIDFIRLCEDTDLKLRTLKRKSIKTSYNEIKVDENLCEAINNVKIENNVDTVKNESMVKEIKVEDNENKEMVENNLSQSLKSNLAYTENSKEKHQCFTCGKIMSSKFRLKTHLVTHSDDRPFLCPHCNKAFSVAQNLKIHLRKHTGEKPIKCKECDATFAHSSGLTAHMRKHTGQMPYCCMLCPRSFRTLGHLQYHVRRHTGEKNFECDTCSRAFITRSQLNQHLLSHSEDRLHVCCVCGLRLSRAANLRRHMQVVHDPQRVLSNQKDLSPNISRQTDCGEKKNSCSVQSSPKSIVLQK